MARRSGEPESGGYAGLISHWWGSATATRWEYEMADKQLARIEAKAEKAWHAEQSKRMKQAMKAVNEVSKQHNRTSMTYGIVKSK